MTDQDRPKHKTFLSSYVRHLLVEIGDNFQKIAENEVCNKYITPNSTFNWKEIDKLFGNLTDSFSIHKQPSDWFSKIVLNLWPVFAEAHKYIINCGPDQLEEMWTLSQWTRKVKELQNCYRYFISYSTTGTIEVVLQLSSILERSLGNVYLLKGPNVPFLLRDLLSTDELAGILGTVPIVFIQVLLGTPAALNLRNIVWHGFPNPEEIKIEFSATLFLIITSIGHILATKNYTVDSLPYRPQVSTLHHHSSVLEGCFPDLTRYKTEIGTILFDSPHISSYHFIYWDIILEHYFNSRYGQCLLLLLPQMEQILRSVFCSVNNCPERVLTAESTVFYTTLDEILAENLNDKDINKMRIILSDSVIEMLQDIFVYPKGPRIRDKFSHGECDLCDVTYTLTNHIICLTLAVILKAKDENNYVGSKFVPLKELSISSSPSNCGLTLECKIRDAVDNYDSKFHLSTLLKNSVVDINEKLIKWKTISRPNSIELTYNTWEKVMDEDKTYILQLKQEILNLISMKTVFGDKDVLDVNKVVYFVRTYKIYSVYRPKIETEILNMLNHIADKMNLICQQIEDGLNEKYRLFSSRTLRSRQRDTYSRMLNTVPQLQAALHCTILILIINLLFVNNVSTITSKEQQYLLRFLKHVLQYVQNLATYTSMEKNRWDEALTSTSIFCQHLKEALKQNYLLLENF